MYAYRAYQEHSLLDSAIDIWEITSPFLITADDATAGRHPLKNGTIGCSDGEFVSTFNLRHLFKQL